MIEREQIEMDVVFVGAGPANLAGALGLKESVLMFLNGSQDEGRNILERLLRENPANEFYQTTIKGPLND
jgi:ribulose 1,5-bisphosphate synthetase/thiazole synthase